MERLVEKLDEIYAESIRKIKQEYRSRELVDFNNFRGHYRDLIKQYRLSKDCGNQTSLVSSTSAVDKDPNETVIDTRNGAIENTEGNVEALPGILLHTEAENNPVSPTRDHREGDR